MSTERDVLRLALDVYEARMAADDHLPAEEQRRLARAAAERVVEAGAPGAVAWLERQRPRTVRDQLQRPRLLARAREHVDAVLREANAEGDVTERMLLGSSWPSVVPHRDRLCWLLSREEGMTERHVAVLVGFSNGAAHAAIARHVARMARELAAAEAAGKEQVG